MIRFKKKNIFILLLFLFVYIKKNSCLAYIAFVRVCVCVYLTKTSHVSKDIHFLFFYIFYVGQVDETDDLRIVIPTFDVNGYIRQKENIIQKTSYLF
jgi:hypothetical protein